MYTYIVRALIIGESMSRIDRFVCLVKLVCFHMGGQIQLISK